MFLRPGIVLDAPWTGEVGRFVQQPTHRQAPAAVFRRGAPAQPALREFLSLLAAALGAPPRPEQGLLIAKDFYDALGGHSEAAADPEPISCAASAAAASSCWPPPAFGAR